MKLNPAHKQTAREGFKRKCLFVLIEGYRSMKKKGKYSTSWEEEDLTAQLIYFMKINPKIFQWKLDIVPEYRLYSDDTFFKNGNAKKAPRIDIRFSKWHSKQQFEYFIEAKNLCDSNWLKEDGTKVNSSYQLNRFINKGIMHFISGHYPNNGCLCGYVLQGEPNKIIEKLNNLLINKSLNRLELGKPINNLDSIYDFQNQELVLTSVFLDFR